MLMLIKRLFLKLNFFTTTFLAYFIMFGPLTNMHLLILDGHGSHVTFEAIEQAKEFGLNMITIHLHTSHAFQPLGVACFNISRPFLKGKETHQCLIRITLN